MEVVEGANPALVGCTLRDHALGRACGVFVKADSSGNATVGADNVFMRNAKGDVVRE